LVILKCFTPEPIRIEGVGKDIILKDELKLIEDKEHDRKEADPSV